MKVTLESTTKIVDFVVNGELIPVRVWEGETANGIRCHAFIPRIAVHKNDDASEFERDLTECRTPSAAVQSIPLRLIL